MDGLHNNLLIGGGLTAGIIGFHILKNAGRLYIQEMRDYDTRMAGMLSEPQLEFGFMDEKPEKPTYKAALKKVLATGLY